MISARLALASSASVVSLAIGTGVALAATFGISSAQLTVHTASVSIAASTCTLNAASADTYVAESTPLSNFGTATNLDVRSQLLANKRTFVQFSLASCAIPANSLVTSASLGLTMFSAPAASRTYDAHRVTSAWTETGVNWLTQPAVAGAATASTATGTTSGVVLSWTVTADVQAFVDGTTNRGWRIADRTENSATSREAQFRSAEHATASERPTLTVSYYQ